MKMSWGVGVCGGVSVLITNTESSVLLDVDERKMCCSASASIALHERVPFSPHREQCSALQHLSSAYPRQGKCVCLHEVFDKETLSAVYISSKYDLMAP